MKNLILLILCFQGFSQQSVHFSLFYESDAYELNEVQKKTIDHRLSMLKKEDLIEVKIKAYADYVDSNDYNNNLSANRAKMVYEYLSEILDTNLVFIQKSAFGERFSLPEYDENGNPEDRRVDLFVYYKEKHRRFNDSLFLEVPIKDINVGTTIELKDLYFFRGRTKMYDYSTNVLDSLGAFLMRNKSFKIEIHGHVCCGGDDQGDVINIDTKTKTLSVDRAKAIYRYLIDIAGVSPERLSHRGYGFSKPKSWPEKTISDEKDNRRVEIKVIDF